MTHPDSALPPEQEERIRALLAEARHDRPIPPEVVARLDRTLAGLASPADTGGAVVPFVRRRRRAAGLLVAAAAVVSVGLGITQVVQPVTGGSESRSAADGEAARPGASTDEHAGDASRPERSEVDGQEPGQTTEPVLVRRRHFSQDARLAQALATKRGSRYPTLPAGCRRGAWGLGTFVPVRYGSDAAVLVLRRPSGGEQVADLFLCGRSEPARSVRLPAP